MSAAANIELDQLFRAMFDASLDAMMLADDQGRYVDANPAASQMFGLSRAELLERRVVDWARTAEERAQRAALWRDFLTVGHKEGTFEFTRPDGERRSVEFRSVANVRPGLHFAVMRDVTERLRAEDALRASERKYRDIVEMAAEGIWCVDTRGRTTFVNQRMADLIGVRVEDLVGKSFLPFIDAEFRERARERVGSRRKAEQLESRLLRADGTPVPVLISVTPILDDRGTPTGMLAMVTDITLRQRALEALERSRAELEQAQAVAHIGSWQADPAENGRLEWSRELYRIFGVDIGRPLTRQDFYGFVHPDDVARTRATFAACVSGDAPYDHEYRIVRPDGQVRWIHGRAVAERDGAGRVVLLRGTSQDVTDAHAAAEALREREERLELLARATADVLSDVDYKTGRVHYSEALQTVLGYQSAPADAATVNEWWIEHMHPDDRPRSLALFQAALEGRSDRFSNECRIRRADGSYAQTEIRALIARDAAGQVTRIVYAGTDISERKRLEEQFLQAQKMEAVGRLAGGVAHDFNNILTAILVHTDFLMRDLAEGDPRREDLIEIRNAGERASGLTRQLLAFSRKQRLEPRLVQLSTVVGDLSKMVRRLVGEDIQIVERLAADGTVKVDVGQIEQVILNLVVNARDAMPGGGRLTIATRHLTCDRCLCEPPLPAGDYVVLSIEDTGCGMDAETMKLIFEPFFTTKDKGKGTGLGLSTSYGIVHQSGGTIRVYSELGKGSRFEVLLPRVHETRKKSIRPTTMRALRGTETVLVIEDDPQVRLVAARSLETLGYKVLQASGPIEAFTHFDQHAVDLVLSDVVMAGESGPDVVRRMRVLRPGLRVLFMSGYTDHPLVREGALPEGTAFLHKPFSPAVLATRVREVLGG